MENKDTERLAKALLADSKLELSNPDFTRNMMNRINAENRKRILIQKSLFYLFLFISINVITLTLMKLTGFSMNDLSKFIELATVKIVNSSSKIGNVLLLYFLFQAIVLLLLIRAMNSSFFSMKSGKQ